MLGLQRKAVIDVFLLTCILLQYYVASGSVQNFASNWPSGLMDWMLGCFCSGAHDLFFLQRLKIPFLNSVHLILLL